MVQLSSRNTAEIAQRIARFAPQLDSVTSQTLDIPADSAHGLAMPPDPNGAPDPSAPRKIAARRAWRFGIITILILTVVIIAFAAATRLDIFSAGFHVSFAMILGIAGTILLGVGLMALSFYSDRSGVDDGVLGMSDDNWRDDQSPP